MTGLYVEAAPQPVSEPVPAPKRGPWPLIAAPALLAAALVLYEIARRSMWLDESASVAIASQHGDALWHAIARDGGNMLAYYAGLHGVIAAFGDATTVVRLPSAIADAATTAVVAALAWRLFASRRIALTAGLLTAVSLPLVFWGQDARGYSLMVSLTAASFLALSWALGPPAPLPVRRRALLVYGLTLLASLYVGFDTALVIPAQLLVAWQLGRLRPVIATLAGVAILAAPLLVLAVSRGSGQVFWVPSLSWAILDQSLVTLTSAGLPPNFRETGLTTLTSVSSAVIVLGGLALVAPAASRWRRGAPLALLLPASWLLLSAVLAVLAALVGEPIELARSSVVLIPALALVLAWLVHDPRLPAASAWALVAVLVGLRVAALAPSYGVSPENWSAAARFVLTGTRSPACIAFYPEDGRMAFDYYARRAPQAALLTPVLPAGAWGRVAPYVERYVLPSQPWMRTIAARCPRLWIIASHEGQASGPAGSRRDLRRYRLLVAELGARYRHTGLRTFGYAAQVRVDELRR